VTDLSPDNIAEFMRQRWRPVFNRRWGRWYLQKRQGDRVLQHLVPREFDEYMEQLHANRLDNAKAHSDEQRPAINPIVVRPQEYQAALAQNDSRPRYPPSPELLIAMEELEIEKIKSKLAYYRYQNRYYESLLGEKETPAPRTKSIDPVAMLEEAVSFKVFIWAREGMSWIECMDRIKPDLVRIEMLRRLQKAF